jgi:serine/threonine protein kinase
LVHRDIKPANLHIGRIGLEYDFVKVLDFGLVKGQGRGQRADLLLTAPESLSGTPAYMSPEMAAGETVDSRTDLYALGCVGYFLLTGSLVFEGDNPLQVVLKHIQTEPVPPSVRLGRPVPEALERVILGCLAKAPGARPADAATLADTLTLAGADDWTQRDAKRWWETTFTPTATNDLRTAPPTEFLEVAVPHRAT